jgi:hypothetical protein
MMQRVSKEELVERLEAALGEKVGMKGLNTLLYGWKKKRRYGLQYLNALKHRDWLYITEVMDFSEYAGYDLTAPRTGEIKN